MKAKKLIQKISDLGLSVPEQNPANLDAELALQIDDTLSQIVLLCDDWLEKHGKDTDNI